MKGLTPLPDSKLDGWKGETSTDDKVASQAYYHRLDMKHGDVLDESKIANRAE